MISKTSLMVIIRLWSACTNIVPQWVLLRFDIYLQVAVNVYVLLVKISVQNFEQSILIVLDIWLLHPSCDSALLLRALHNRIYIVYVKSNKSFLFVSHFTLLLLRSSSRKPLLSLLLHSSPCLPTHVLVRRVECEDRTVYIWMAVCDEQ